MHIIVPFAYIKDDNFSKILANRQLQPFADWLATADNKNLSKQLRFSLPQEILLANLQNMAAVDGLLPYGELYARRHDYWKPGTFWARAMLCSWQVSTNAVTLLPFETLAVSDAENQQLLNELNAFFAADGITLYPGTVNGQWLASSSLFEQLPTASLARLQQHQPAAELLPAPTSQAGKILMRLQQETQMLLHTHPINQSRRENNASALNGIIFIATGSLPANYRPELRLQLVTSATTKLAPSAEAVVINPLAEAAQQNDWLQWQHQWLNICNILLPQIQSSAECLTPFTISLCSNDQYLSFHFTTQSSWCQKLAAKLKPHRPSLPQLLEDLS